MARLSTVLVYDWELSTVLAAIEEKKNGKKQVTQKRRRPAVKRAKTPAAKRRREDSGKVDCCYFHVWNYRFWFGAAVAEW